MGSDFSVGIIISTYNNSVWLEKVLIGYMNQTVLASEIVIADDGSRSDTKEMIDRYSHFLPITHVWHEDNGFQKSAILNKAIVVSKSDYLIFTDQDCIPRYDFIETHIRYAQKGYFLSGGYFKLPMFLSLLIAKEDIESRDAFSLKWLRQKGLPISFKCSKLFCNKIYSAILNTITPAKATWNGCNASGWRSDIIEANGFNEDMHYGGQDREFGERLINKKLRSKQIRYSAIVLHLDHKRPYKTKESMVNNLAIRKNTKKTGIIKTPNGIVKL